jgi:hypothetical protein
MMTMMTGGIDEACGAIATTDYDTAVTKVPCGTDGATIVTGLGLTGISRFWWPSFLICKIPPDSKKREQKTL